MVNCDFIVMKEIRKSSQMGSVPISAIMFAIPIHYTDEMHSSSKSQYLAEEGPGLSIV